MIGFDFCCGIIKLGWEAALTNFKELEFHAPGPYEIYQKFICRRVL